MASNSYDAPDLNRHEASLVPRGRDYSVIDRA